MQRGTSVTSRLVEGRGAQCAPLTSHSSNSRVAIQSLQHQSTINQSTNQPIPNTHTPTINLYTKMLLRDLVSTLVSLPTSPGRLHFRTEVQTDAARSTSMFLDELSSNHLQDLTLCSQDGERSGQFSPSHQSWSQIREWNRCCMPVISWNWVLSEWMYCSKYKVNINIIKIKPTSNLPSSEECLQGWVHSQGSGKKWGCRAEHCISYSEEECVWRSYAARALNLCRDQWYLHKNVRWSLRNAQRQLLRVG